MTNIIRLMNSRGAITVLTWAPVIALLFYFLGGILPILIPGPVPTSLASSLQNMYSNFCHQIPERSFCAKGLQAAFCARCTGYYGALALASLFVVIAGRLQPISFTGLIVTCLPMVVDVIFDLSALVDWPNLGRVLSGTLAGVGTTLFIYPRYLELLRYSLARRQRTC